MRGKIGCIFFILFFLWSSLVLALTISEEKKIGETFFSDLKRQLPLISDPVLNQYYNEIGQRLLNDVEDIYYPYYFFIINDPTLNAFSVPGGYIFMYRGLFLIFEAEDELAAVTAHEIGHIVCRHIARRLEQGKKLGLATMIAMLAGAFLGGEAFSAIGTTSLGASMAISLKYSRQDEEQADREGLNIHLKTGYDGEGMLNAFRKMARFSFSGEGKIPTYLKTHPDLDERIVYLAHTLKRLSVNRKAKHDQTRFRLMQARLRGLYTDIGGARNFFKIKIHHDPKDPIGYYGLALCSMRERDWQKAINQLNKALELRPNELLFRRDLGICYANMGRFDFALSYLEGIPQDVKQAFYLGLGYKEKGNMDKAIKIWQLALNGFDPNLCVNVNDYSLILYHLSSAFSERDQMDWAHYYLGHYFKLEGNQQQASDHFKKAQELTKDQTLKTKIEKDGFIKEDQKRNKK